jgi:hypothetical protein
MLAAVHPEALEVMADKMGWKGQDKSVPVVRSAVFGSKLVILSRGGFLNDAVRRDRPCAPHRPTSRNDPVGLEENDLRDALIDLDCGGICGFGDTGTPGKLSGVSMEILGGH